MPVRDPNECSARLGVSVPSFFLLLLCYSLFSRRSLFRIASRAPVPVQDDDARLVEFFFRFFSPPFQTRFRLVPPQRRRARVSRKGVPRAQRERAPGWAPSTWRCCWRPRTTPRRHVTWPACSATWCRASTRWDRGAPASASSTTPHRQEAPIPRGRRAAPPPLPQKGHHVTRVCPPPLQKKDRFVRRRGADAREPVARHRGARRRDDVVRGPRGERAGRRPPLRRVRLRSDRGRTLRGAQGLSFSHRSANSQWMDALTAVRVFVWPGPGGSDRR